jgi:hypothetical protein
VNFGVLTRFYIPQFHFAIVSIDINVLERDYAHEQDALSYIITDLHSALTYNAVEWGYDAPIHLIK